MTHARPSDPDPAQSPDVDSGGSPTGPQTPDSDSTSMQSDTPRTLSPTERQSPTKKNSNTVPALALVVIAVVVLLLVVGLVGYLFVV